MKQARQGAGRPRSFDRQVALERAMEVFWQQGYESTSLADLTAAMGIAPPSLYAAFGNKQKLFLEAVAHYGATHGSYIRRALEAETPTFEAIERLLRDAAVLFTARRLPRGCFVVLGALNCSPASAEVEHELRGMRGATEAAIAARIRNGVKAGDLPPETDAAAIARFVATMLQGLSVQARDGASCAELESVVELGLAGWRERVRAWARKRGRSK